MKKKIFPCIWIICVVTFELKHIGEVEFISKDILGYEPRSLRSIDEKKWGRKSRASIPLITFINCV